MPPTTGWTLDFFNRTIQKSAKLCRYKKTLSETRAFITSIWRINCAHFLHLYNKWLLCANMIASFEVSWAYCMTVSWKQLCWVPRWSAGKNKWKFLPVVDGALLQQHLLLKGSFVYYWRKVTYEHMLKSRVTLVTLCIKEHDIKGTDHDFCWSGKPIYHLQKQGNIHVSK